MVAAMTRTLKDYRPQHDEDCAANYCRRCGKHGDGEIDRTFGEVERCARLYHSFEAKPCSCGLAALLQAERPQPSDARAELEGLRQWIDKLCQRDFPTNRILDEIDLRLARPAGEKGRV